MFPVSGKVNVGPSVRSVKVYEHVTVPAGEVGSGRMHC